MTTVVEFYFNELLLKNRGSSPAKKQEIPAFGMSAAGRQLATAPRLPCPTKRAHRAFGP
jgi:hypothetical protein